MKRPDVLRTKEDFNRLKKHGKSIADKNIIFVFLNNSYSYNRKAFLASKKIGNSVQRHRAARLLRESFRLIEKEHKISSGNDLLFIAKYPINNLKCADVKKSIEAAMKKAGLI